MANIDKKNLRYNILTMIVYIIGIILLLALFNLQIVHGQEYYDKSSTRLTRETTIEAARGDILDRNGNVIAGTIAKYNLEIYKSKIDNKTLNDTILNVVDILESNGDKYKDTLPISINPIAFTMQDANKLEAWKKANNISDELSAEDVLNQYKQKYGINSDNIDNIRKIATVRYGIEQDGYTTMKSYVISDDISTNSVAKIEEQSSEFPGISINEYPQRNYPMGSLASHVVRICSTYKPRRTYKISGIFNE